MKQLKNTLDRLGLPWDSSTIRQFEVYRQRILEWNESVNLTAIKDPEEFEAKHFCDSLMIGSSDRMEQVQRVIDVGTGAGFPGIPLAIIYPEKKFTLMDSLGKRMKIIGEISQEIGLNNVEVIHSRAEELARKEGYRESFDLCVSRAVANLSVLAEYCIPFVKVGGWFAPYKTSAAEEEIEDARQAIRILGGRFEEETDYALLSGDRENPDIQGHTILWIKKAANTLAKYPRKAGTPSKDPLK